MKISNFNYMSHVQSSQSTRLRRKNMVVGGQSWCVSLRLSPEFSGLNTFTKFLKTHPDFFSTQLLFQHVRHQVNPCVGGPSFIEFEQSSFHHDYDSLQLPGARIQL